MSFRMAEAAIGWGLFAIFFIFVLVIGLIFTSGLSTAGGVAFGTVSLALYAALWVVWFFWT